MREENSPGCDDRLADLAPATPCLDEAPPAGAHEQYEGQALGLGSLLDLVRDLEQWPTSRDRSHVIVRYRAWIDRNSAAPATLYAAYFNLGVELSGAGDKAGAASAYQSALSLRTGFYPAAINLGTLLEAGGQIDSALDTWGHSLQSDESRATLLEYRDRLTNGLRAAQQSIPTVLRVGGGSSVEAGLLPVFFGTGWREITMNADPERRTDFIGNLTDMHVISDELVDAVYASRTTEDLRPRDLPLALQELSRVLKPAGFAVISLPDMQEMAPHVAGAEIEQPICTSPSGTITLPDSQPTLASADGLKTQHTALSSAMLADALINARFEAALIQRDLATFRLTAIAFRSSPDEGQIDRLLAQMLPTVDRPIVLYRTTG